MIKKVLLSFATLFLIWQSYRLLSTVETWDIRSWGVMIFVAWIINLFITGVFAFSGFAFATHRLLPRTYYTIRNPKGLERVYNTLKVDVFRKLLLATLWRSRKQQKGYFDGKRKGISHFIEQSMKSEFGHLFPFVILCCVSIYLIVVQQTDLGILTLLINVVGNLYPVILQRHHRKRIERLKRRQ